MSVKKPFYYSTWDIETTEWVNIVAIGYYTIINNRVIKGVVKTPAEMLDIMEEIGGHWFAHASGLFDNKFLLDEIFSRYDVNDIKPKLIQNKIGHIEIFGKFVLRDSYYLFNSSLKDLGIAFGTAEQKRAVDRKKIHKLTKAELEDYVISDCEILYEVLQKAEKETEFNFDLKALTISQNTFSAWKKTIDKTDFLNMQINQSKDPELRPAYFGGRTEVFKRHGKNLNYYDVNSMYPHVMFKYDYPLGKILYTKKLKKGKIGIYNAEVYIPENCHIPPIPIRNEKNGKIIFPVGRFKTMLPIDELNLVKKVGGSFKIIDGFYWEEKANFFHGFISHYYAIKKEAEKGTARRELAKRYQNHLYGKMAQRQTFSNISFFPPKDFETMMENNWQLVYYEDQTTDEIMNLEIDPEKFQIWTFDDHSKRNYSLIHHGLLITSYARITLWEKMNEALENGGEVYYCDTDSFITDIEIKIGKELGEWDLESKKIKEGIFISPKLYALKFYDGSVKMRAKGCNITDLEFNDYIKLLNGETVTNKKDGLMGFKETLRRKFDFLTVRILERHINGAYDKRLLDGVETKPLIYF